MPKKHSGRGRQNAQAPRPQPKHKDVLLVSSSSATQVVEVEEASEKQETGKEARTEAPKSKAEPAKAKAAPASAKALEKRPSVPARASTPAGRPNTAQRPLRPGQRSALRPHERAMANRAQLVSADNYRYVLKDLRLIAALAVVMFGLIVGLTFVVPHLSFLNY